MKMLDNVRDMEFNSTALAMVTHLAGILCRDFRAAFLSVAWLWIWLVLKYQGVPLPVIIAVMQLYRGVVQFVNGRFVATIYFAKGVTQGDPIAAELFNWVLEPLVAAILQTVCGIANEVVMSYLDDIGMVLADICKLLPSVAVLYMQFEWVSGLVLNINKCVLVPVWYFTA